MKVIVVTKTITRNAGGLFFSVKYLCKHLSKREDLDLELVSLTDNFLDEDRQTWNGVKVKVFKDRDFFSNFGFSISMIKYIIRERPDLIHVHGIWNFSSLASLICSYFLKSRIIVSPRGMLDPWILSKHNLLKKLYWFLIERRLLSRSTLIHTLNRKESLAVENLGLDTDLVEIPNGIEKIFKSRRKFSKCKKLVFISRLDQKKGVIELVNAWKNIRISDWTLHIYGWGDTDYCNKLEKASASDSSIFLEGPVYGIEKEKALTEADAFVLPSFSEGLPMAVLEAWAYLLPTLITDGCNLENSFSKNAAFRLDNSSSGNIEIGLRDFLSLNDEELKCLSIRAKQLVEDDYLWSSISEKMYATYKSIVSSK